MMMSLGLFVFSIGTAAYQQLARASEQRWAATDRPGQRAAQQYLGKGEETISLSGALMPEVTGGPINLAVIEQMASSGKSWTLVAGTGVVLGQWIIKSLSETQSVFMSNGAARKIEFTLELTRVDDDRVDLLGDITPFVAGILS